jgi:outer membrane protein TolC
LKHRHDYLASSNDVEASVIGLDYSKKGMLPRLNLNFGAGYNGLYQAENYNQYFNPLFYNIPGMNYNVGLTFDIAPRYDLQKGQRIQAMALNESLKAELEYQQLQIKKEVRKDCDQLKFYLGASASVNQAVDLSKKALENEIKKLEMGISTAFNVALMQNNYLNTLERQIGLLEQLNQSLLQLKHHTGTLLEATGNSTFSINPNQLFELPQAP